MIIKSVVCWNLLEEQILRFPADILERKKADAGCQLGKEIVKHAPFVKDIKNSWPEGRKVPVYSEWVHPNFLVQPPPEDQYVCEVAVLSKDAIINLEDAIIATLTDIFSVSMHYQDAVKRMKKAIHSNL